MKKHIVYDTEFREDLGLDAEGYHRIRMGRTVYCVKDNVIFTADGAGTLNRLEEAGLPKSKWWIRRNVNEVLGLSQKVQPEPKKEKLTAQLVRKTSNSYVVAVGGAEYIVNISSDFTRNFDEYVREANAPSFSWLSVQTIKNGMKHNAPADVVNDPEFQKAVKAVVNPQRKLDRVTRHHSFARWNSRHECEQYKIAKHNTDASGTSFK